MLLKIILSVIIGYILGSLNASLIVGKLFYKKDVREHGSMSAGATNTLRTLGKGAAIAVTVFDVLKGISACLIGQYLVGYIENYGMVGIYLAGLGAVLGHNWPLFFGFKGGKGVLTTFSVILYISPVPALISLGIFVIVVILTKYVSLGSIVGAISWPIISIFFNLPAFGLVVAVFMVVLIVFRHKPNIERLLNGTEKKLSFKRSG